MLQDVHTLAKMNATANGGSGRVLITLADQGYDISILYPQDPVPIHVMYVQGLGPVCACST